MADGSVKPISSLIKDDRVLCNLTPPGGQPVTATVACILIKLHDMSKFPIAGLNLLCTEEIPIKDPSTGQWKKAEDLVPFSQRRQSSKASPSYSVLLEEEAPLHSIVVENVVVAALGCNAREGYSWDQDGVYNLNPFWEFYGNHGKVSEEAREVNPTGFQKGRVLVGGIRRCGDDDGFCIEAFQPFWGPTPAWLEEDGGQPSEST